MSLNIKNEETCRLAAELARMIGQSMTGAITSALREHLAREKRLRGMECAPGRCLPSASAVHGASARAPLPRTMVTCSTTREDCLGDPRHLRDSGNSVQGSGRAILRSQDRGDGPVSVANLLEAAIVIGGRGESAESDPDRFVDAAEIELMPVTAEQVARAREAWRRFGKGNHPAALNFGDCFAYALALTTGKPLLFKGEDFSRTGVEPALAAGNADLLPPAEEARGGSEGVGSQREPDWFSTQGPPWRRRL